MNVWQRRTCSARATRGLARRIGSTIAPGTVVALTGDLGAGKTTFVQGLAEGLGVFDLGQVLSPTFTLVNEYAGERANLVHIDFYRLDDESAACALGIDEQIGRRDAITAVEWADRLPALLGQQAAWVRLELREGSERHLQITGLSEPRG